MDTDAIERLKQEWTDRRVGIAGTAATLRRFAGREGTVMTVNMNGRALVQFDGDVDVGWYDLAIETLQPIVESNHDRHYVTRHLGKHSHSPPEPATSTDTASIERPSTDMPSLDRPSPEKTAAVETSPPSNSQRPSTAEILQLARQQGAAKLS